jgi:hypothetical protein|eukprot:4255915-Prymnesium_polylepis.1
MTCNTDLAVDARRDLDDIGAKHIKLQSLTDTDYGDIAKGFKEGVLLVTYTCLIKAGKSGKTRFDQLVEWLGSGFDGVLAFDEAHKAKGAALERKVCTAVVALQDQLAQARVVYLSATGATQVQDMSYMSRLGMWGAGTFFADFSSIEAVLGGDSAAGAMEMLAVQLKSSGSYLARNVRRTRSEPTPNPPHNSPPG